MGCQNTTYSEKSVTICNPGPRIVRLDNVTLDSNRFTWSSPGLTFPKFLPPDSCVTITVRMSLLDTSRTLLDTLRIVSDELCVGSGLIPISGRVQDVLGILLTDGKTPLKSMNFGDVCPGMLSIARGDSKGSRRASSIGRLVATPCMLIRSSSILLTSSDSHSNCR